MCKIGDIIVVKEYIGDDGVKVGKHSFIVVSNRKGNIEGLDYDVVANALSSFKNEEHREKVLKRKENLEFNVTDASYTAEHNRKSGFVKVGCLVYFKEKNIDYFKIGSISVEMWEKLEDLLKELDALNRIKNNTNNLIEETQKS